MKYASTAKKILSAGMAIAIGFSVYTSNVYAYTDTSATATVATYNAQSTTPIKSVKGGKWVKRSGKWYYKKSGKYIKGFAKIDRKVYYFNKKGVMKKGLIKVSGRYYFFNSSGYAVMGWKKISGKKYYFSKTDYYALTGVNKIGGKIYLFTSSGTLKSKGWRKDSKGNRYYVKKEGYAYAETFKKIDGKTYYFNKKGVMATGLKKIDVYYYFFSDDGVMQTGWLEYKGEKYYFESKGYAACGWKQIDGDYYYFADNGQMFHDTYVDDDLYVGSDGRLVGEVIPPIPEDGTWQDDKIDDVIEKLNEQRKEWVIESRSATWYVPLKANSTYLKQAKQECLDFANSDETKAVISGNASASKIASKLSNLVGWNSNTKYQYVNIGIGIYYKDGKTYVVAVYAKGPSGTGIPVELPDPS